MPFSFIDIEEGKTRQIVFLFIFLVTFYFFGAWVLTVTVRLLFLLRLHKITSFHQLFLLPGRHLFYIFITALLVGSGHWLSSRHNRLPRLISLLRVVPLDKEDRYHRQLRNIVDEVAVACGGRQIDCLIMPSSALNAFSLADQGQAIIGTSEGLLARLNRSELEAVIAHEAAHIVRQDTLIKTIAVSLFSVFGTIAEKLGKSMQYQTAPSHGSYRGSRGGPHPYLIIVYLVSAFLYGLSKLISMFISRQCEYRADAVAVRLTRNPLSLAQALRRISTSWRGGGLGYDSLESLFVVNPNYKALDEGEGVLSNLFSTHPPVMRRIGVLLDMGHSDFTALKPGRKVKRRRPTEVNLTRVREPRWQVLVDNNWQGPFGLMQLAGMNLRYDSFVQREGKSNISLVSDDEALLELLRQETGTLKGGNLCPRCRKTLSKALYEGAPLHHCDSCQGVLVEDVKISRILSRQEQGFSPEVIRQAELVKQTAKKMHTLPPAKMQHELRCPGCGEVMLRHFYNLAYPIEVDSCYSCHATWFDRYELEILQYLVEQACPQQRD